MKYSEAKPCQRLSRYVECFWQLESGASDSAAMEPIPPDGCAEIVFNCADSFRRYNSDNTSEIQPKLLFVGQMTGNTIIQPTGQVSLFGIKFKPSGAFVFLRSPIDEFTDKTPGLDLLLGPMAREMEERINLARFFQDRIRIAESALLKKIDQGRSIDIHNKCMLAAERIAECSGQASIDQLSCDLGVTARHLERQFRSVVGIGPKLFARIIRFQNIFKKLNQHPSYNWSAIAYECGYYDQSHLIRDFKQFAGQNPTSYLLQQYEMANNLSTRVTMSDFSNTVF